MGQAGVEVSPQDQQVPGWKITQGGMQRSPKAGSFLKARMPIDELIHIHNIKSPLGKIEAGM